MQTIATYSRTAFLKDHPPVLARMELTSTGTEQTLLAGTVIGSITKTTTTGSGESAVTTSTTTIGAWEAAGSGETAALLGVLAGDVTVPASGNAFADVYVHAAVVAEELQWADGVSATEQKTAIINLRAIGIYA